jgi:four helix bundle protein
MDPAELRKRTKKFAVDVIKFAKRLPHDRVNNRIAGQLTDSATSVAAGYRAVCRARSRADFLATTSPLWQEADELTRILVRSRETARSNRQSRNRQSTNRQSSNHQ